MSSMSSMISMLSMLSMLSQPFCLYCSLDGVGTGPFSLPNSLTQRAVLLISVIFTMTSSSLSLKRLTLFKAIPIGTEVCRCCSIAFQDLYCYYITKAFTITFTTLPPQLLL